MKELKLFSTAGIYQTPSCEILSVNTEGILCQSFGDVKVQDLEYDGEELGC